MSASNVFRAVETARRVVAKTQTKIKGTFLEKLGTYIKVLFNDYKEVAVSVQTDIKQKPLKAALFFTGMGIGFYSLKHNPTEQDFRAKFIECANEVALVSPLTANPLIVDHLNYIQRCYNENLIRRTSFGLFSFIWVDRFSDKCGTYETNCSYLKIPYSSFHSRIIDVGFLNIWWGISRKMLDYDINF